MQRSMGTSSPGGLSQDEEIVHSRNLAQRALAEPSLDDKLPRYLSNFAFSSRVHDLTPCQNGRRYEVRLAYNSALFRLM